MPLAAGIKLGPYEILSTIGAGGMGEVYRARDTRLDRVVAVKVLPEHLAHSPEALARFQREAKAVAALSHPNILALYDVGADRGVYFVVTELLEGETLRSRLARPMPWRKAVEIGLAVADGLAAAHAKGIVHRDLKPENIFLTSDAGVKILDFGLARIRCAAVSPAASSLPTETDAGTVLGTVGYMSPEQVRGDRADAPSDIFSLGCVLYEMLSGHRAFVRGTAAQTMAAVLEAQPPDLTSAGREIPAELDRLVTHCLEKNSHERFQSARDLRFALRAIPETSSPLAPATSSKPLRPWALILAALTITIVSLTIYWRHRSAPVIDSVAVLPFANASGDPNTEYLSDGIAEQLINSLSQARNLRVTARSLAFRYKGPQVDPQKAGRDLRVSAVLTGRVVERAGLDVQVDLINVEDGSQLWGRHYSRRFSEILSLQDDIAREVSEKLGLKSTVQQQKLLAKRSTQNNEAYQAYLRGHYYWNRRTEQAIRRAAEYFQQAIDKDPGYALAYAGLADCYATHPGYQVESPRESWPKAKAAATKALEIDNTLAEAHATLANTRMSFEWDWAGAEREFQRSIELDPNYPSAGQWYGECLAATGRTEQAIASSKRAQQLDPLSLIINTNVGSILSFARRHDEAIEQIRKTLEMDPNFIPGHWYLGRSYTFKAMYPEAIAEFQKALELELSGSSPGVLGLLGNAYALAGNREKARRVLAEVQELSKRHYVAPMNAALIYTGLGDKEHAFEWLEKALEDRSRGVIFLKVEPQFDTLRADPRFKNLLRRLGLEP